MELYSFTAIRCRAIVLLLSILALVAWISASGCSIKQTIKVNVPQGIRQAKTATFEELLGIIRSYDKINSLACNEVNLTFTSSRKIENGILEKYPKLDGYILLKRPDSVHLVLQVPILHSTLSDVVSVGDDFSVWSPKENRFYEGKNSFRELVMDGPSGSKEFNIPIRGPHIFEAIFPQSVVLDAPGIWIDMEEQSDSSTSYYVLSVLKEGKPPRMHTIRKIWIERLGMTIARQQVFGEQDQVVSDIFLLRRNSGWGFSLPLRIQSTDLWTNTLLT